MSKPKGSARAFFAARGAIAVAVAAIIVVVVAATMGGASIAKGNDATSVQVAAQSTTTGWPVNERGETFGSDIDAKSEADVPDLVAVVATNGKHGYCLNSQFNAEPPSPKTAEEAAAMMHDALCEGRVIPVYTSDGVTQIGVFQIGGPGTTVEMGDEHGNTVTMVGEKDGTLVTTTEKTDGTVVIVTERPDGTTTTRIE